jgi:hypothetical protein
MCGPRIWPDVFIDHLVRTYTGRKFLGSKLHLSHVGFRRVVVTRPLLRSKRGDNLSVKMDNR